MGISIPITGWAANDPVPGNLVEVAFGVGPAAGGSSTYPILLLGNKTSAGTATTDTVVYGPDTSVACATENDVITLFGRGSELHRMWKRVTSVNTVSSIYLLAVTASGGAAATLAITYVGTASANLTGRVHVGDESVDFAISNGDTVTTIAANAAIAVNAKLDWGVTATSSLGVLTLTARQTGLRGNWLRGGAQIIGSGTTTVSPGPMAFFSGGTTADSYTTALSTILAKRYYYIASADDGGQSSGNLTALCSQVLTQALPTNGIRQTVIAGACDTTPANINTIAIAQNSQRAEIYYQIGCDVPPAELAALMAGASAAYEAAHGAGTLNFDSFGQTPQTQAFWKLRAPKGGQALTRTQIASALNNGVSPIGVTSSGAAYLVSRITTKSQTSGVADYRTRDAHKVRICDWWADDAQARANANLSGKNIANDPASPAIKPPPNSATPSVLKRLVFDVVELYGANGLIDPTVVPTIEAGVQASREVSPTTRLTAYVPLQPIDVLHQTGIYLAQVA